MSASSPTRLNLGPWSALIGVACVALLLGAYESLSLWERLPLFGLACWCSYVTWARYPVWSTRQRQLVWACAAFGLAVAVAIPFRGSNDVWSYHSYGRLLGVHHANPYTHTPADIPGDFAAQHVADAWQHTTSVYGPTFVWIAAGFARLAGSSVLATRLLYQGLAALAWCTCLALLARRGPDSTRVACALTLSPPLLLLINGGHNDLLLGCAALAAVLMIERHQSAPRLAAAGALLGLGIGVKATGALIACGTVFQLWRQRRTAVIPFMLGISAIALVLLAPFGTTASSALSSNSVLLGGPSPWRIPMALINAAGSQFDFIAEHGPVILARVAMVVMVAAACKLLITSPLNETPLRATIAYQAFGLWIMPWYYGWALPTCALMPKNRAASWAIVHFTFVSALALQPKTTTTSVTSVLVIGASFLGSIIAARSAWKLGRTATDQ